MCLVFLLLVLESHTAISTISASWHLSMLSVHAQAARNATAGEEAPSHLLLAELPVPFICSGSSNKIKQNIGTPSNQLCLLTNRSAACFWSSVPELPYLFCHKKKALDILNSICGHIIFLKLNSYVIRQKTSEGKS